MLKPSKTRTLISGLCVEHLDHKEVVVTNGQLKDVLAQLTAGSTLLATGEVRFYRADNGCLITLIIAPSIEDDGDDGASYTPAAPL